MAVDILSTLPHRFLYQARRLGTPAGRFGSPEEFGKACAFLCSAHAGYITAQNFLIDGGNYPGTF